MHREFPCFYPIAEPFFFFLVIAALAFFWSEFDQFEESTIATMKP